VHSCRSPVAATLCNLLVRYIDKSYGFSKLIMVNFWSLMKTNRLKQFKVLVETSHLRKAAELLRMSHAGLYKSIRQLEAELSVSLFYSQGKRLEITEEGKALYKKIPGVLASISALTEKDGGNERPFTVGTFEVFSTHLVSSIFKDPSWEKTTVRLLELIPGELETAISEGDVDLGITYIPIPTRDVDFYKVGSLKMGVYRVKGAFPKTRVSDMPFVVPIRPIEGSPTGVKGLDGWPENMFERKVRFEVDLMETGLEFARRGSAVIFLPEPVARFHNETVAGDYRLEDVPLEKSFPVIRRDVYILKRKSPVESKAEKKIASALRQISSR
jgi:DNA-binding transcriptional LysR family regulator